MILVCSFFLVFWRMILGLKCPKFHTKKPKKTKKYQNFKKKLTELSGNMVEPYQAGIVQKTPFDMNLLWFW